MRVCHLINRKQLDTRALYQVCVDSLLNASQISLEVNDLVQRSRDVRVLEHLYNMHT